MKLVSILAATLTVSIMISGCGTIYSAAVDEREVRTISSDTSIELKIKKQLADGKFSDVINVSVTSYRGDVFLVGEYESVEQKDRFVSAARAVEGVASISSYFLQADKNNPCGTKQNVAITAKVKSNLIQDSSIWSTNVNVKTMKCQVVLWGTVGKAEEVEKSISHAKAVEGVQSVKSFLKSTKR